MEPDLRMRVEHWPNGNLKLKGGCAVVPHGCWQRWYVNGQLEEELWMDRGVRHGAYRQWSATGALVVEGEYRNGKQHGMWRTWRADRVLMSQREYVDGAATGDGRIPPLA